jgi:hypothetical protein
MKCMIITVKIAAIRILTTALKKFESQARRKFNIFTIKDNYTWNIKHNIESLKPAA